MKKNKLPFSRGKVTAPNAWFDYVLLLGCLTLLTFIAYLQAQYNAFGNAYGLATFIPMVILFFCAYYFDHLGVLSMAITNLAAWAGIAVTPLTILKENNFGDSRLIFTGLALGVLLVVIATASGRKNMKAHFAFTYLNFALNILFIATIAGMFYFDKMYVVWLLPIAAIAYYFYKKIHSTFFLLFYNDDLVVWLFCDELCVDAGTAYDCPGSIYARITVLYRIGRLHDHFFNRHE